jgi:hypothetical protein
LPEFDAKLEPNNLLQKASFLAFGNVRGPETLALSQDGLIYTGLANGDVVEIATNGSVTSLFRTGNGTNCGKY